jgi:hypothetical protein
LVCHLSLFFTLSVFAPRPPMYQGAHNMPSSMCQGVFFANYISPCTCNMPKTCLGMPRWKKMKAKVRLWEEELEQYPCTDYINDYGHMQC